jgi:hypothetical protein
MEAPPLQHWLALRLRTLGLDDAVFAPYIHALLTEAAEGGGGQDGNVEATLASLCPPQQEQQVRCENMPAPPLALLPRSSILSYEHPITSRIPK